MPSALVTGANRGIGLEFVRQYAADGWRVFAACRRPAEARDLAAIKGDVRVHALDVADDRQIGDLARTLANEPLDLLVNNAGVYGPRDPGNTETATWLETLRVNSIAPVHVARHFIPNLERGSQKKIVGISSGMGSIADNSSGGHLVYRTSKAALNMAMRSLAMDLKSRGFIVIAMSPGWVKTDMGGPGAPLTPQQSVTGMRRKIAALTAADSGVFFRHTGEVYPW